MDRRSFLKTSVAASLAVAIDAKAQLPTAAAKPNVLYVFSDQHRAASLPGEPLSQVIAPNIDAFRRQSVSMDACISNYPLCSPHRAILMSGLYPPETGVDHNGPPLRTSVVSLGETFRSNGYHTGYVGKWHLNGSGERGFIPAGPRRFGFEDWHVWDVTNEHYHSWTYDPNTGQKIQPEGWSASHMTDQAVTFLQEQPAGKPWFLILSWNPPHPPFNPPDEDKKPYPLESLQDRPNVRLSKSGDLVKTRKPLNSLADLHEAQQGYYGGITGIDLEFARVLKALDESGHAGNTIVIYTSDHGEMMGSHGHMAKQMPHEESCRVPFLVRTPGTTQKGRSSDVLFSSVDIYPSLCGLAGVPVPSHCRGRNLSAALRGEPIVSPPEHVFLTNQMKPDSPEQFTPTYRGLRTATHTYAATESGRWLLYDNANDPYQLKNLVKDPTQAARIAEFDAEIQAWIESTGDKFPYKHAIKSYAEYSDYPAPDRA